MSNTQKVTVRTPILVKLMLVGLVAAAIFVLITVFDNHKKSNPHKVGDSVRVGDFTISLLDYKDTGVGGKLTRLTVTNTSGQASLTSSGMFQLEDSAGRRYDAEVLGTGIGSKLNPQQDETGDVIFSVPGNLSDYLLAVRADAFSDKYEYFTLK